MKHQGCYYNDYSKNPEGLNHSIRRYVPRLAQQGVESQSTWNRIILNLFVFCFLTNHYCQTKKHEALYTHFLPKKVIDSSFSAVSVPMILLSD